MNKVTYAVYSQMEDAFGSLYYQQYNRGYPTEASARETVNQLMRPGWANGSVKAYIIAKETSISEFITEPMPVPAGAQNNDFHHDDEW